jgi:hypothetical protein
VGTAQLVAAPVLASSDQTHFALNASLGWLALAALLGWLLLLQIALWTSTPGGIDPGPESLDFGGPESPAVANLLVGGWRLTPDAATATLVDLAGRHILGFEQQGPRADQTVVRVLEQHPQDLTPYERRIFSRVTALVRGGIVPAAALVRGDESWAKSWWRGFRKEAIAEARSRGLSRDRWSAGTLSLLRGAALIPVAVFCLALLTAPLTGDGDKDSDRFGLVVPALIFGWAILIALVERFKNQRDTPAGRAAAARWLGYRDHLARDEVFPDLPPAAVAIWDRHLAYATSFGIARTTIRVLPLGARSDTLAWSAYGGSWHQVKIRYPRGTWGFGPWKAGFRGLVQVSIGIVALRFLLDYRPHFGHDLASVKGGADRFDWVLAVPITIAALILLRGAVNLIRGLAEYPSRRVTVGEVVRLVRRQTGDSDNPTYLYFAGIDDGKRPRIRALRLTDEQYLLVDEGDEIRVVAGPYLGKVFSLDLVRKASRPADAEWESDGDGESAGMGQLITRATELAGRPNSVLEQLVAGQASSGASIPDPATLVTAGDVAAALGVAVTAQETGPSGGLPFLNVRMCTYRAQQLGYPRIMVQVSAGGMGRRLAGTAQRRGQPVPGIPGAYTGGSDRRPGVVILRGEVSVAVNSLDAGVNPALLARLAGIAADRLTAATPLPASPGPPPLAAPPGPYGDPGGGA